MITCLQQRALRILYYLRFDTLFALGTMATVALLVLARIQNLFITFFGAIGPRLTWPRASLGL